MPESQQFKTLGFEYCRNDGIAVPLHPEFFKPFKIYY